MTIVASRDRPRHLVFVSTQPSIDYLATSREIHNAVIYVELSFIYRDRVQATRVMRTRTALA